MNTQTDGNIDFNDTSAYPVHTINSPGGEIQKIQSETTGMGYKLFKLNGRLIDRKEALFDHIAQQFPVRKLHIARKSPHRGSMSFLRGIDEHVPHFFRQNRPTIWDG